MSMRPIGFASLRDTSHCNKKIKKLPGLDRGGGVPKLVDSAHILKDLICLQMSSNITLLKQFPKIFFSRKVRCLSSHRLFSTMMI